MIGEADSKRNELSYEKIAFLSLNYKNITNNTF